MAGETIITVVGNLTSDPEMVHAERCGCRELHHRVDPAHFRPSIE
jgi:hypothetical protein